MKLSDNSTADPNNPPLHDTRLLREWMDIYNKFAEIDEQHSKDSIVTDCLCRGTGWIGKYPGGETACKRHIPILPYQFWTYKKSN